MIRINKEIVKDIKEYFNLRDYCRHFTDYQKENELNELKEKIYNYFDSLNENAKNDNNNGYYQDFYLSNESINLIINIIDNLLKEGYNDDFYLYSDEECFYTLFNEFSGKDRIIIDLLERLQNPVDYMLLNLFCEPSNRHWNNKLFEIRYNIMLTTEKLEYNCYKIE